MAISPLRYNPFDKPIDDNERTLRKHYDNAYAEFLKSAESRVAYQLSLRYFLDANPVLGSLVTSLTGAEIVLVDTDEPDNAIHYLFVGNCLPVRVATPAELLSTALLPGQVLVLAAAVTLDPAQADAIRAFVQAGGLLLSFNRAVCALALCFPDCLSFKNGESTLDKRIDLKVEPETEDAALFLGLQNASDHKKAVRLSGTRRFQVNESNGTVQVLVRETSPSNFPIACRINHGSGRAFHFIHVGTDELLELRSREKAQFYCKQVDNGPNINASTKLAWKTALQCSHGGSFYLAISLLPFFDVVFGIINKYARPLQKTEEI